MLNSLIHTVVVTVFLLGSSIAFAGLDRDIKVVIEEPAVGESYSGVTNLRGWVVSPAGVGHNALEVHIDGEFAFYMPVGGNRADVAEAYPNYPDSDQSGFSMAFNYKSLSPGPHEITVLAFDNVGNYNDAVVYFDTERFESEFIADGSQVDLSTTEEVYLVDNHSYLMTGVTLEGRQWDFMLSWDKASQSFRTENIKLSSGQDEADSCDPAVSFGCSYDGYANSDGDAGGSNLPPSNGEVFACLTYSVGFNSAGRYTMENGLELATQGAVGGWATSESGLWHIVFKTQTGDWYMIANEKELFEIAVAREPDTCREYEYGLVTGVGSDNQGDIVLDFQDAELKAVVGTSCPIGVGSKLASYEEVTSGYKPQGEKQWVVDLLTADACEVKAWYSS